MKESLPFGRAIERLSGIIPVTSRFPRSVGAVLLGLILCGSGAILWADDPLPTKDDAPQPRRATKTPARESDEKLIRQLDPAAARHIEAEITRLERAISGMREANQRIEADDTSTATLEVQRRVIDDLEKLLNRLQQQQKQQQQQQNRKNQPPQGKAQPQSQAQDERHKLRQRQLDPQNSGGRPEPQDADRSEQSRRANEKRASDAQENLDPAKAPKGQEAQRQQLVKDVWGHLPPHLREAMRNNFSEKYLPKYEELVKRYYESLAEKSRSRSEKGAAPGR